MFCICECAVSRICSSYCALCDCGVRGLRQVREGKEGEREREREREREI